jgi:hypothetical protein
MHGLRRFGPADRPAPSPWAVRFDGPDGSCDDVETLHGLTNSLIVSGF